MNKHTVETAIMLAMALSVAGAAETSSDAPGLRYGGDLRARQEMWNEIPIPTASPNITRGGYNNTFRFRSRAWASLDFAECASANLRLTHMFYETTAGADSFEWPDELVVDNANIELRGLTGDGSRFVAGRQDIILGSGRLVLEGTPLDASRTTYFDGVLLHQPLAEGFSSDIFAVYDKDEDPLAVGNVHRQLRGYSPVADGRDEAGVGVFLNGTLLDGSLPGSLYYVWKHETTARNPDGSEIPNADIHTLGLLLRPRFSNSLSGEFEYARQFDPNKDDGIDAALAFAGVTVDASALANQEGGAADGLAAKFGLDCLYLSGDDPDTKRNEAFNPIFSRYPFMSELVIYCFDTEGAGNWNNIIHPRATAALGLGGHTLDLGAGPVYAEERNGAGGGRHRGDLYTAQYSFPLLKGFKGGRGKTDGHLRVELFDPGDYYTSDKTAYYFRWEILVSF